MSYPHDNNFNPQQAEVAYSPWNPFTPTERDVQRTEELANKNPTVAGILAFVVPVAAMFYLNRGVNNVKIIGYVVAICFVVGFTSYKQPKKQLEQIGNGIGTLGAIAIIVENVRCVTLARKRLASQSQSK
ncbi:MAG: hypothetical protein KME64_11560 [Scytonematopsis contorta HA4267-MV1]|jgi:hypothetical protein|nr:hypothetical protein [Scytonematopsis contorta HA4267-MV1]